MHSASAEMEESAILKLCKPGQIPDFVNQTKLQKGVPRLLDSLNTTVGVVSATPEWLHIKVQYV
jgi:hypothetical protein